MKAKRKDIQKLKTYSKDEIIDAIDVCWNSNTIIREILGNIEYAKLDRVFKEHDKALAECKSTSQKYCEWLSELSVKYGDGKNIKIADIPMEELKIGAKFEKAMTAADTKERKLNKELMELLGVEK